MTVIVAMVLGKCLGQVGIFEAGSRSGETVVGGASLRGVGVRDGVSGYSPVEGLRCSAAGGVIFL